VTAPRPRTKAELWNALEAIADERELARIDALGDDVVDAELRAAGVALDDADQVGGALLAKRPRRRARLVLWLAAAAVVALVLTALITRRDTVARPAPPERGPDDRPAPQGSGDTGLKPPR
jgi:hypothetical protein